jgi:hypothetical protein
VTAIGLGWRIHSWWAVVVAVSGPAVSPVVVRRERVTLLADESLQEPYHAAAALVGGRVGADAEPFLAEARALIESVEKAAATAAAAAIRGFVSQLGSVAAVGVVGGNRKISTELLPNLATHARLHESERNLYEQAVIRSASRVKLPVTTIPATGALIDHASEMLGVALAPSLAALGKSIGQPWQKNHREATAAALVALDTVAAAGHRTRNSK